jgi:hypothetical protein
MWLLACCVLAVAASGDKCQTYPGVDVRAPKHFDEVNSTSPAECCDACGSTSRCVFWAFKASDVPNGNACKRFDSLPTKNTTSSAFVSGSAPPPGPPPPPSQVRLKVTGSQLIDPSGKAVRLTGFNWPLEHVHPGDGQMMLDKMPGVNVARLIGVLWDNSPARSDCYTDTSPFFKESW